MANIILSLGLAAVLLLSAAFASDPSPLQDFCVADPSIRVNGAGCMDPSKVNADQFSFSGLHLVGDTTNPQGSAVTPAPIPGLNTLGLSLARIDFAQGGVIPPHSHPRASEVVTVLQGTVLVAFITSNPQNRLISKVLNRGDVFVFPQGLVHYLKNVGTSPAFTINALGSQNPGVVFVGNAVFGSKPPVPTDVLAKSFQVDDKLIQYIQSKF